MTVYQTLAKGALAAAFILGQAGCSTVQNAFNYIKKPFVSEETSQKAQEETSQKQTSNQTPKDPSYLNNFKELPPETELHVNTSPNHYWVRKSLGKGEEDLIKRTKNGGLEEAFVYDEKTQRWLEIGIEEGPANVKLDTGTIDYKLSDFNAFHIHPSSSLDPINWKVLTDGQRRDIIYDVIPSDIDCRTNYSQGVRNWSIATKLGIVDCLNHDNDFFNYDKNKKKTIKEVEEEIEKGRRDIEKRYNEDGLNDTVVNAVKSSSSAEEAANKVFDYMNKQFAGRTVFALRTNGIQPRKEQRK